MTATKSIPETRGFNRCHDPFRGPDWRWQRARSLHELRRRPDRCDDEQVRMIFRFQKRLAQNQRQGISKAVRRRWPDLAAAYQLHERGGILVDEIQARLLAGEDFERIAAKTGTPSPVLQAYESVFFNVTDSLPATDWLLQNVLQMHTWAPAKLTTAQVWQWTAVMAGPFLLDIVIAADLKRPEPALADRASLAKMGRFWVREAVTPMTATDSLRIAKEARLMFGPERWRSMVRNDPMLSQHIAFLRLAAAKTPKTGGKQQRKPRRRSHKQCPASQPQSDNLPEQVFETEWGIGLEVTAGGIVSIRFDASLAA